MKYLITLLLFILPNYLLPAQNSIYPDIPFTNINFMSVSGNNIYTAGSCNTGIVSKDKGVSWDYIALPADNIVDLAAIDVSFGTKAYYLFPSELHVLDINKLSFHKINTDNLSSLSGRFRYMHINEDNIFIIGKYGVFKSKIEDDNWTALMQFNFANEFVTVSDISDNYMWLGTSKGRIFKIDLNSGDHTEPFKFDNRISSIEMVDDNTGYYIFQGGAKIYKTIDGAGSFHPLSGMPETINPLAMGQNILITVNTNRIYVSTDGGKTSKYIAMPKDGYSSLNSTAIFSFDTTLYLAGRAGMILKSEDLGESFIHLNPVNREDFVSIIINKNGEGYALGTSQNIVHTTDNGATWSIASMDVPNSTSFNTVISANETRFLIGHDKGISLIENNQILINVSGECLKLFKSQINDNIYAVINNNGYFLMRSIDYGNSWIKISAVYTNPSSIKQVSSGKIFITTVTGKIASSDDHGLTWENLPLDGFQNNVTKFDFLDDDNGIISSGNTLYSTNDGGKTVFQLVSGYNINNLHIFNKNHFLYTTSVSETTLMYETTNGGISWQKTGSFCTTSLSSYYDGINTVWFGQKWGHINKHIILNTSRTNSINNDQILTVYPNPVAKGQSLNLKLSQKYNVSAYVYDINSGRLIKTFNGIKNNKIQTENLKQGMYLLKVTNSIGENYYTKFVVF